MVQCGSDKKIIDYNELIAEKLSNLQKLSNHPCNTQESNEDNEFKVGLVAREVEVTMEEEIEEVEITPQELLENAQIEAEQILEDAKKHAEMLKQQAYQEGSKQGYESGYNQSIAEAEMQKEKLQEEKKKLQKEYEIHLGEMEPMLVDAITTVVQNVFKVKFEDNRNIIVHLVKIALGRIENSREFLVKVSKADYPYVLKYREVLEKTVIKAANIEIIEDMTLSKNQCLIETDGGVFDCSLDVQLDNLTKTLKILSLN
jgi:flagellar assembly protein FliH